MIHGRSFGDTWPADDPVGGVVGTDSDLSNVNAPMGEYLLLERALCECVDRCRCDFGGDAITDRP